MKILNISTDRNIFVEGSAVRARMIEYSKNLDELHIVIFSLNSLGLKQEKIGENLFIYPTNSKSKSQYVSDAINLGLSILNSKNYKSQVSSFMISCQDPFETGLVGLSIKKETGIGFEVQIHTDLYSPYFCSPKLGFKLMFLNTIRRFLANKIIPKASHIRVVSEKVADSLVKKFDIEKNKIEIRPIKVDEQKIRNFPVFDENNLRKKYPQFKKIILMASRLSPEKNIGLAIKAVREVVKTYPEAGLIIVGSGPLELSLKLQVKSYGLQDNVIFESWTENIFAYYKTADIFLNTSFYEGYGMSIMEAYISGCKVISTDVGIALEISQKIVENEPDDVVESIINFIK